MRTRENKEDGILRIVSGYTKAVSDASKMTLRAVLSSETVDRYGDVIMAQAFNTKRNFKNYFEGNPLLLWSHGRDCAVANLPVGTIEDPSFDGIDTNGNKAFEGTVRFTDAHQFAIDVWKLYEKNVLRAFSVGFRPVTVKNEPVKEEQTGITFLEVDLLENSAVPIPANPAAMRRAFADGDISEEFLEKTFFRMRDEVLVRNSDIFIPTNWHYKDSINDLALMAAEIRSGSWKPYVEKEIEVKERKAKDKPPVVKTAYECLNCGEITYTSDDLWPEKSYHGEVYRDVTCEHCESTTEQCIEAAEILLSISKD